MKTDVAIAHRSTRKKLADTVHAAVEHPVIDGLLENLEGLVEDACVENRVADALAATGAGRSIQVGFVNRPHAFAFRLEPSTH